MLATITVVNSEFQDLQVVELDVSALSEDHPLIIELRRAWDANQARILAQIKKEGPGDIFALG